MKYKFTISGIDCANCASKLEYRMSQQSDIDSVKINFMNEKITVVSSISEEQVLTLVQHCARAFDKNIEIY